MNKRCILFAITLLCGIILLGCIITNQQLASIPEKCLAKNMLIQMDDISASQEDAVFSPMPDEPANSAIVSFSPGYATMHVAQHQDKYILDNYQSFVEFTFRTVSTNNPWSKPVDLSFESTQADEFDIRCGYIIGDRRCIYVARFRNYLVYFGLSVGPENYSSEDFEAGMLAIDREMSECFTDLDALSQ